MTLLTYYPLCETSMTPQKLEKIMKPENGESQSVVMASNNIR
jgi:hypothetical protein